MALPVTVWFEVCKICVPVKLMVPLLADKVPLLVKLKLTFNVLAPKV